MTMHALQLYHEQGLRAMNFMHFRNIGPDTFLRCYQKIPLSGREREQRVCKMLNITRSTLNSWLSWSIDPRHGREPQRGATIALWYECGEGASHIYTALENELRAVHGLAQSHKRTIDALKQQIESMHLEIVSLKKASRDTLIAANDSFLSSTVPKARASVRQPPAFAR